MNGGQAVFKALVDAGLDTCFANPGTSEMQLVNEIGLTKGVRPVLCLQENTVTGAADGYGRMAGKPAFIERALEENPNWTYNDLAPWRYAELPRALGCADWFTARVATLGELDAAMKTARESKSGAYIEIIGGRLDVPPILAFAHGRLKAMYGDAP